MQSSDSRPFFPLMLYLFASALAGALPLVAADGDPMPPHGIVSFDLGGNYADTAQGIAALPDGRVVLAGTVATGNGTYALGLARFHANGNLDISFGNQGRLVNPFGLGSNFSMSGIALVRLRDGRLLVAGSLDYGNGDQDFYVGRLLENGTPDGTFGSGGLTTVPFDLGGDLTDSLSAMATDRSGRILLAGTADVSATDTDFAVARLTADGSLDTDFSGDGKMTVSVSQELDFGLAVAAHPAGGLVVGGAAWTTDSSGSHFVMALARVLANGSLDVSFGVGGIVVIGFQGGGTNNGFIWALGVWPDGEIVAAGDLATGPNEWQWLLQRFSTTGQVLGGVIGSFCSGGPPQCPTSPQDSPRALLLQGDGKIVFAGFGVNSSGGTDFGVARYQRNLFPDSGFGPFGSRLYDFQWGPGGQADWGRALAFDRDGRLLVAGQVQYQGNDTDFGWIRFDSSYIFADSFDYGDGTSRWSGVVNP